MKYLLLDTVRRSEETKSTTNYYTVFSLYLVMKNGRKRFSEVISIPEAPGYQFNNKVAELRNKALEIATMVGCNINYGDKISPGKRLQPANLPEKPLLKKPEKVEERVATLRDKALEIVTMIGHKIKYGNKILPGERLHPAKLPEKTLLKLPVKSEFESIRDSFFIYLIMAITAIGFIVYLSGTWAPPNLDLQLRGILIVLISPLLFFLLRFLINDHLLMNSQAEYILLSTRFLFFKRTTRLCPLKDVKYVKLNTVMRTVTSKNATNYYTDFYLQLDMKNNKKQVTKSISISEKPGYQFNNKVASLRDKALEIATMVKCKIRYSNKIPPEERLQPVNLPEKPLLKKPEKVEERVATLRDKALEIATMIGHKIKYDNKIPSEEKLQPAKLPEKPLLKEPEKKEFSNITRPLESREVAEIPMDDIESDFLCYEENKICPSCGEKHFQNKYCNDCGKIL